MLPVSVILGHRVISDNIFLLDDKSYQCSGRRDDPEIWMKCIGCNSAGM